MTGRRQFILGGAAGIFAGCASERQCEVPASVPAGAPVVRFGMFTDSHCADLPPDPVPRGPVGRRYYRESLRKLREAVDVFNARKVDFAIELGDFKDNSNGREGTLRQLAAAEAEFARFRGPRYHVAGNHDFDCLSREEFLANVPNDGKVSETGWYSFLRGGVKFVVLNACFDKWLRPYSESNPWNDANVPPQELEWFGAELKSATGHVVVFCHQRLDDSAEFNHLVKNAAAVRKLIEDSGKVVAVVTGHQHCGGYHLLNGIPYYSLRAMVCDSGPAENSYAEMAVYPSGAFAVTGWRNAVSVSRGVVV